MYVGAVQFLGDLKISYKYETLDGSGGSTKLVYSCKMKKIQMTIKQKRHHQAQ